MKYIPLLFLAFGFCVSCGGPKLFKNPEDFMGGNRAAAAETHCARNGGMNKEGLAYKLMDPGRDREPFG